MAAAYLTPVLSGWLFIASVGDVLMTFPIRPSEDDLP
jgi:hypothetical protein